MSLCFNKSGQGEWPPGKIRELVSGNGAKSNNCSIDKRCAGGGELQVTDKRTSSGTSKGLKRKRVTHHTVTKPDLSSLTSEHDSGPMLALSSSSTMIANGIAMKGMEDDGPPMDLGLGLMGPSPDGLLYASVMPAISEGRSTVTSLNSGANTYLNVQDNTVLEPDVLLGLQPWPCSFEGKNESSTALNSSPCPMAGIPRNNDSEMQLQLGPSGNSVVVTDMDSPCSDTICAIGYDDVCQQAKSDIPVVDEGSTSARSIKSGGYIPSLLMGRTLDSFIQCDGQREGQPFEVDCSANSKQLKNTPLNSLSTGGSVDRAPKTCRFKGCGKGSRGASGLCIIHGGGKRCQKLGCNKGAEGSAIFCKAHGGGRRCTTLGCTRSAEGKTDHCIGHGGGKRCSHDGCTKAARGRSGLCIRHGGGKRCQKEGCTKSAEGYSGLCISHGGGRRCQFPDCTKGAQGSTMFCKAHGGGKRCMIQGCNKGAEGSTPLCKGHGGGKRCMFDGGGMCTKSVHGGTSFCVAHGGGKRCAVPECTRSARGRTDFCVRHGGGKRCKFENCTKSAQGSTDFCKAHGGGKRCTWGQENTPYGKLFKNQLGDLFKGPCDRFARGKIGLCAAHSALVQDRRVHGAGTIGNALPSGIGPGLFRGLVLGSKKQAENIELSTDASKQGSHSSDAYADHGSECVGSDSFVQSGASWGVSEGEVGPMDEKAFQTQEVTQLFGKICESRISSSSIEPDFNLFPELSQPVSRSSADFPYTTWPGSMQDTDKHMNNMQTGKVCIPHGTQLHGIAVVPTLRTQPSFSSPVFNRPLIPPQVLVPLSMQKEGFLAFQRRDGSMQPGSFDANDDTIFNMSSLSLPEERVHAGRVQRGSLLALLSGGHCEDLVPGGPEQTQ